MACCNLSVFLVTKARMAPKRSKRKCKAESPKERTTKAPLPLRPSKLTGKVVHFVELAGNIIEKRPRYGVDSTKSLNSCLKQRKASPLKPINLGKCVQSPVKMSAPLKPSGSSAIPQESRTLEKPLTVGNDTGTTAKPPQTLPDEGEELRVNMIRLRYGHCWRHFGGAEIPTAACSTCKEVVCAKCRAGKWHTGHTFTEAMETTVAPDKVLEELQAEIKRLGEAASPELTTARDDLTLGKRSLLRDVYLDGLFKQM